MNTYTPIQDVDQKIDIIDHVNQDHPEEVLAIARCHRTTGEDIQSAKVLDIFKEGVNIEIQLSTCVDQILVPFQIKGDLEDQILYLAYAAIVKEGRDFRGNGKHFFEVLDKQDITKSMVRITVKSATPLPEDYPGYAYAFLLKTMQASPQITSPESEKKSWQKQLFDRFFVWLMKHLSPNNREKLLQGANKDVRLYTLRKSWKHDVASEFCDRGYIDVFTHGETSGSEWVKSLAEGDVIMSRSESPDKHAHLEAGKALLIADETAYPALAGILEKWTNPLTPHVILISSEQDEKSYFEQDNIPLSEGQVHHLVCTPEQQSIEVLSIIKELGEIDVVWGACEAKAAKDIRHHLRNERKITGRNNHTKAYWNLKTKR
ncbi:SIP domain-containing protein [Marinomonas sp.]|nr:siderophore-interacting protein [Marinomonas sp.]MDB4837197.1 SIP domain-containing protein [Marinomonas sp.]